MHLRWKLRENMLIRIKEITCWCLSGINRLNNYLVSFRYIKLSDLVDQMFPPFKMEDLRPAGLIAPDQFSSFTYWRAPLPRISMDELSDADGDGSQGTGSNQI